MQAAATAVANRLRSLKVLILNSLSLTGQTLHDTTNLSKASGAEC
jgi:hypothetical protein